MMEGGFNSRLLKWMPGDGSLELRYATGQYMLSAG
jgi:hypothetical protein